MIGPRTSEPIEIRVFAAKVGLIARLIAGFFCMIGGAVSLWYGTQIDSHRFMIGGATVAVLGAWSLPSVWDNVKPIIAYFFPNGIPLIGRKQLEEPKKDA